MTKLDAFDDLVCSLMTSSGFERIGERSIHGGAYIEPFYMPEVAERESAAKIGIGFVQVTASQRELETQELQELAECRCRSAIKAYKEGTK